MSRSSAHYAPPRDLPRTPDVHPAVRELVAVRYGIATPDSHRAEGDVRTLAAVLPHLLKRPDAASRDFRECFPLKAML